MKRITFHITHSYFIASLQLFTSSVAKRMGRPGEAARSLAAAGETVRELDDNQVLLFHATQSASLRMYLGDRQAALDLARKAYKEAVAYSHTPSQLEALLLLNRLAGDREDSDDPIEDGRLRRRSRVLRCCVEGDR